MCIVMWLVHYVLLVEVQFRYKVVVQACMISLEEDHRQSTLDMMVREIAKE